MMAKLYDITGDLLALNKLLDGLETPDGEPREPTEDELETMKAWFETSEAEFKAKFDNYCKFIKNLKITAADVEAERKSYSDELNRLSRRAKAFENRAKSLQNLLRWGMERLELNKYKTDLFSAGIQNTQKSVALSSTADPWKVPREYLKAPELDTQAIKKDLSDGVLYQKEGMQHYAKLYYKVAGEEKLLEGVTAIQGTALVIR